MRTSIYWACGLSLALAACQTESLDIQRTFPFQLEMDGFPASIPWQKPTSVGFGIKPEYLMSGNAYRLSWQVAAPRKGVLLLNNKVLAPGGKIVVSANMSRLLSDTLTYLPTDSGSHALTLRVVDSMGQSNDTTFTLRAVN
ncbi:TraQ conjugal transfer family protein [Spirosoma jeollabukense]